VTTRTRIRRLVAPLALAALLVPPRAAHAAGYGLYEMGARALGQAGAFTARADDPSSIYFNPAGLSRLDGKELLLSPNLIVFKAEFSGVAPSPGYGVQEETFDKTFPPFAIYYAQGIGKKVAAGIGIYNPYGLEVEWANPDQYTGRYISTRSRITPFYFVPTAAVAINDRLRVGAGFNLVLSNVALERHIPAYDPFLDQTVDIGTVKLDSENSTGIGFNAGVQWWPPGKFKFGGTYRSKVDIDYSGRADFTQRITGNPAFDPIVTATFPPDQQITSSIPFPAQGSLGIAYQSCPSWAFEGDFNYTWWGVFDQLEVNFAQTPSRNLLVVEDWKNAINVRVGAEYRKGGTAPWSYRAGYYFDETPQPRAGLGPLLPDSDRHGISLGIGHHGASTTIHAYGLWLITPDRSTEGENRDNYNGTYSLGTFVAGLSLGQNFH
jgi:long-chain fatty acid transport protein